MKRDGINFFLDKFSGMCAEKILESGGVQVREDENLNEGISNRHERKSEGLERQSLVNMWGRPLRCLSDS